MFTKEFLDTLNAWQSGSGSKSATGSRLKSLSQDIDPKFKTCNQICFRSLKLLKTPIFEFHTTYQLPESISAWTTDLNVAKEFKDGILDEESGYHSFIFAIQPTVEQVILNLNTLYSDSIFLEECEKLQGSLYNGIFRYGNTQKEVIIELSEVGIEQLYAYGGHSRYVKQVVERVVGRPMTDEVFEEFLQFSPLGKISPAGYWVSGDAKDRVFSETVAAGRFFQELKEYQRIQRENNS